MSKYRRELGRMVMKDLAMFAVGIVAVCVSIASQAEPVLTLSVGGQAQPQLTDPAGILLGANASTGQLELGIANAQLSLGATSSYMELPNPAAGSYNIVLNGSFEENLMVRISYIDRATGVFQEQTLQMLFHGIPISFSAALDPTSENPLVVTPPAGLPTGLDIEDNAGNVRLTWTPATDPLVTKYRIYSRLQRYPLFQLLGETTSPLYDTAHNVRFDDAGDHWKYIIVGVTDDGRESFYSTILNNIIHIAAVFDASTQAGQAPLTVAFSDASIGNPIAWAWDFDDDGVVDSTEQNPTHIYTTSGKYTVRLTITGSSGTDEVVKMEYIDVTADDGSSAGGEGGGSDTSGSPNPASGEDSSGGGSMNIFFLVAIFLIYGCKLRFQRYRLALR